MSALLALSLALAVVGSDSPPQSMPAPFNGLWSTDPSTCFDPDAGALMDVAGNRLQFYEWGADITALQPAGDLSVRFDADWWDISDVDENERPIIRSKTGELTLSPDRTRLTLAIEGETTLYVRCPEH